MERGGPRPAAPAAAHHRSGPMITARWRASTGRTRRATAKGRSTHIRATRPATSARRPNGLPGKRVFKRPRQSTVSPGKTGGRLPMPKRSTLADHRDLTTPASSSHAISTSFNSATHRLSARPSAQRTVPETVHREMGPSRRTHPARLSKTWRRVPMLSTPRPKKPTIATVH